MKVDIIGLIPHSMVQAVGNNESQIALRFVTLLLALRGQPLLCRSHVLLQWRAAEFQNGIKFGGLEGVIECMPSITEVICRMYYRCTTDVTF